LNVHSRFEGIASYAMILMFSAVAIYPILSILFLALHSPNDLVSGFALPNSLDLSSFKTAWESGNFATGYMSSAFVALMVTAISAVFSVLAGYAVGTMRFPGQTVFFGLMVLGIVFPYEATVIPLYFDFQNIHPFGIDVAQVYWALILPQIGTSVAFGVVWMRAFFREAPRSLIEAARIDGASTIGVLNRILLPQARAAILTMCALVFMWTWNEFLLALVLIQSPSKQTAPLGLSFFASAAHGQVDRTKVAAASILVAGPILLVYVLLQRHFLRGITAGAVKG
jgi:raffinose/stachyose/melibiose transport system permease protein